MRHLLSTGILSALKYFSNIITRNDYSQEIEGNNFFETCTEKLKVLRRQLASLRRFASKSSRIDHEKIQRDQRFLINSVNTDEEKKTF